MGLRIPAGLDTEYGFVVEARSADTQIEDATEFVRMFEGAHAAFWDYRHESPRADLRGFRLERLAQDPVDALFDRGKAYSSANEIRSDRILATGGRLYNDHGHPEYATPECFSLIGLAGHELAGDKIMLALANKYRDRTGRAVKIYKNNTDFHGASWGTHENYLVKRNTGYDRLYAGVMPILLARQVLTGSGKVGAETGDPCAYQISQRADFLVEPANAETLYRRPLFNTRDEPHARHEDFIRLHVICGDANRISKSTIRKAGLVKLAIALTEIGEAPVWDIADPVRAFKAISRDDSYEFRIDLKGGSWTNAQEVIESYLAAAERFLELDAEITAVIQESRQLFEWLRTDFESFARSVDWAAKRRLLEWVMDEEGLNWNSPALRSYDMAYHDIDPEESLFNGLIEMGWLDPDPLPVNEPEATRASVRSYAVRHFGEHLRSGAWRSLTFDVAGRTEDLELSPIAEYWLEPDRVPDVISFIETVRKQS
jgi:proteasome accessory factor A